MDINQSLDNENDRIGIKCNDLVSECNRLAQKLIDKNNENNGIILKYKELVLELEQKIAAKDNENEGIKSKYDKLLSERDQLAQEIVAKNNENERIVLKYNKLLSYLEFNQ
jgi:hypothetical protein